MRRKLVSLILTVCLFGVALPASAADAPDSPFAIGWIYTPLSSGLTVKIPLQKNLYIQPLLFVDLYSGAGKTQGYYSVGVRGMLGLPINNNLFPYVGCGIGQEKSFQGTILPDATADKERTGYQAFFGMEFRRYPIKPAVEVGVMGLYRSDGTFHLGTTLNLGIYYYL